MKKIVLVTRVLLGLVFFGFGLVGIIHPMAPPPTMPADATTFLTILGTHHYATFIALLEVVAGLLLIVGRYVPLGLTILAPIVVNILLFHLTLMGGSGIAPGLIVAILELFLIWAYRLSFRGLFDAAPEVS